MNALETDLLEAIPAGARRILVIGEDLLRHRAVWEMRNPMAEISAASGPWTKPILAGKAPRVEAAILSLDELGDEAAFAIGRALDCLAPAGTLTLFAADHGKVAPSLTTVLADRGLVIERRNAGASANSHEILRFCFTDGQRRELLLFGYPMVQAGAGPIRESVVRVRMQEPFAQLNSVPGVRCHVSAQLVQRDATPLGAPNCDNILIIQRTFIRDPEPFLERARAQNFITILEIDDDPSYRATTEDAAIVIEENLRRHHAIQTSTPQIADRLRKFNPEVGLIGNHLDRIPPYNPRKPAEQLRIGFAAINREAGWASIIAAYRDVVAAYGDRIVTDIVGDRKFFDALSPLRRTFQEQIPYVDYLGLLEKCDIVLLPLADTPFDRGKTDLKFIECAGVGTAVLASHIVYGDTVRSGKTGYLYRNVDEFKRHLRALIEEPSTRERVARHAHRYVCEHRTLANHVQQRIDWYRSLVDRRDELERLRRARVS